VAADEFGETIGPVDRGRPDRSHLVQDDGNSVGSRLPGGLGTGEPTADDGNHRSVAGQGITRRCPRLPGGFDALFAPGVVAVLVVAENLASMPLRGLLDQVRCAALGTGLRHRTIPEDEIAVWIVRAAEEYLAAPRLALDDVAALVRIEGTLDAGRLLL